jgi:hypothetical protein
MTQAPCGTRYVWPEIGNTAACGELVVAAYKRGFDLAKAAGQEIEADRRGRQVRALRALLDDIAPSSDVAGCDFNFLRGLGDGLHALNVQAAAAGQGE